MEHDLHPLRTLAPALLGGLLLAACGAPDPGPVHLVGHGGAGLSLPIPQNTAASVLAGLAMGLDGVELDVQLTADGVLVAYHDQDLSAHTACTGLVNAHAWAALQGTAGCPLAGSDGSLQPLPRLDSLLVHAARQYPAADFSLDIKLFAADEWWPYLEAFATALARLHALPELRGRLLVECMDMEFLELLERADPTLPRWLYVRDMDAGVAQALAAGVQGITLNQRHTSAAQVAAARKAGLQVCLFAPYGMGAQRRALRKGPDRLQTDQPQALMDARRSRRNG